MIEIRKTIVTRETVFSELGVEANRPITRAVGMAVIRNPFAGQFVEDLRPLFEAGAMLGEQVIDLPLSERPHVMRELSVMGITAGTLFPGLDGACEELKERNFDL